jgi:hypothetical protein
LQSGTGCDRIGLIVCAEINKMFLVFATLGAFALIFTFTAFVIATIKTIRKNTEMKKWWLICIGTFWLFIALELIAAENECDHEFVIASSSAPSCTERGEILLVCEKCDRKRTEYEDALGHSMSIISRVEPTVYLDGEIVSKCGNCGFEEIELISKLDSSLADSEPPNVSPSSTSSPLPSTAPVQDDVAHIQGDIPSSVSPSSTLPTLPSTTLEQDDSPYIKEEAPSSRLAEIDSEMITTLIAAGYSLECASTIQKSLNTVGILSIEIENMTGSPMNGLNSVVCYPNGLTDRNRRFYFTTDNGELFYAGFATEDLFDVDRGGFLMSYGDVHVPETKVDIATYDELRGLATEAIKSHLSVPSSANFHAFSWGIGRSDDKYKIQGAVTAQNALGVKDDLYFAVYFISIDGNFSIEGIVIDGARVR